MTKLGKNLKVTFRNGLEIFGIVIDETTNGQYLTVERELELGGWDTYAVNLEVDKIEEVETFVTHIKTKKIGFESFENVTSSEIEDNRFYMIECTLPKEGRIIHSIHLGLTRSTKKLTEKLIDLKKLPVFKDFHDFPNNPYAGQKYFQAMRGKNIKKYYMA